MKNINKYYTGFNGSNNKIDYLKYGLLNNYGDNLTRKDLNYYDENNIIKTTCNSKND